MPDVQHVMKGCRYGSKLLMHVSALQSGGGMPYGPGGPFPGVAQPMPYGQALFSGPPSPGNVSTVGSMAKDAEHVQRAGSPRSKLPSVDSMEASEAGDHCAHDLQTQQEQEALQQQAAGTLLFSSWFLVRCPCRMASPHRRTPPTSEGKVKTL